MKKKYKCRQSASSLLVTVNKKVIRLEFEPAVINQYGLRGCSYTTDDKDIQRAIEHSKRFNSMQKDAIWTDDKEPEVQKVNLTELPAEEVKVPTETRRVARRYKAKKEV